MRAGFWNGKRVLITGHTGFKGSWLALWLHEMNAHIIGCALAPPPEKNLYSSADVGKLLESHYIDIRDGHALTELFNNTSPDIVFHLAAQSLVLPSYDDPVGTYETNVIGTLNVLEAIRFTPSINAAVIVTTDKCYENRERLEPYRESDSLGGHDPYSSSKACAEILVASYRKSYFSNSADERKNTLIATARAGNVVGGGDWSPNRLLPDLMRAIERGEDIVLRNPSSVRPWQHVLESLAGYLLLAEHLGQGKKGFDRSWNFGPDERDVRTVEWVAERIVDLSGTSSTLTVNPEPGVHEATILKLDSSDAKKLLGWNPKWHIDETIQKVSDWYGNERGGSNAQLLCRDQIREYAG